LVDQARAEHWTQWMVLGPGAWSKTTLRIGPASSAKGPPENGRRTEWQIAQSQPSIQPLAASAIASRFGNVLEGFADLSGKLLLNL
jgi:hypothetical protein